VAYVPRNESAYLGSNASGPVDVQQVEPTLTVREHTEQTSFGEPAGAIVAVTVDGQPVDGIPVVADVAGQRVGRATTNDEGAVRVDGPLPATVPAGDQELRVAVPLRDRAIAAADEAGPHYGRQKQDGPERHRRAPRERGDGQRPADHRRRPTRRRPAGPAFA